MKYIKTLLIASFMFSCASPLHALPSPTARLGTLKNRLQKEVREFINCIKGKDCDPTRKKIYKTIAIITAIIATVIVSKVALHVYKKKKRGKQAKKPNQDELDNKPQEAIEENHYPLYRNDGKGDNAGMLDYFKSEFKNVTDHLIMLKTLVNMPITPKTSRLKYNYLVLEKHLDMWPDYWTPEKLNEVNVLNLNKEANEPNLDNDLRLFRIFMARGARFKFDDPDTKKLLEEAIKNHELDVLELIDQYQPTLITQHQQLIEDTCSQLPYKTGQLYSHDVYPRKFGTAKEIKNLFTKYGICQTESKNK